jgi:uncharacterized membrane protein YdjX (TVP38/TMEM64 family)
MSNEGRLKFFSKNLFRGLLWAAGIILIYVLVREYLGIDFEALLEPLHDDPFYVYLVFAVSEVIIGIIPPELFMIWASHKGGLSEYIPSVLLLSILSYSAGILGFWAGRAFADTRVYSRMSARFFREYIKTLRRYGGFLIVVAAMTPLPFSGVALIVGATGYKFHMYLLVSLTRFVRFAAYAYVVWLTV